MARRRPFRRTDRLQSQIHQILALAVQRETHEPALQAVVLTGVEVTSDISLARVFYYPMGADAAAVAAALERARGFLRRRVGDEIRARITPDLRFIVDTSVDRGRRIEEILGGLTIAPADPEEDEGDEDDDELAAYEDEDALDDEDEDALDDEDEDALDDEDEEGLGSAADAPEGDDDEEER